MTTARLLLAHQALLKKWEFDEHIGTTCIRLRRFIATIMISITSITNIQYIEAMYLPCWKQVKQASRSSRFWTNIYLYWWSFIDSTHSTPRYVPWSYQLANYWGLTSESCLRSTSEPIVTLIKTWVNWCKLLKLGDGGWSFIRDLDPPIGLPWDSHEMGLHYCEAKRPNKPLTLVKSEKSTTGGEPEQRKNMGKVKHQMMVFWHVCTIQKKRILHSTWACK